MVNEADRLPALTGLTHTNEMPLGPGKSSPERSHPGGNHENWRELLPPGRAPTSHLGQIFQENPGPHFYVRMGFQVWNLPAV